MQKIVDGKVVFFHCQVGTDRTGTIAYLLEGILGVSKEQRFEDYELSYLFLDSDRTRKRSKFQELYKSIHDNYSKINDKDQSRFINWFLKDSSNPSEDIKLINNFRKAMINGTPTKYKISNGKLVEG